MIRRAKVADAPRVHAILLAARDDISLDANFADDAHKEWVRARCRDGDVWVRIEEGRIAGAMVMSVCEIFYLVVAPDFRRSGIGEELVRHAVANVWKRYKTATIAKTKASNAPAHALIERLGFVRDYDAAVQPGWDLYRSTSS